MGMCSASDPTLHSIHRYIGSIFVDCMTCIFSLAKEHTTLWPVVIGSHLQLEWQIS